ncbi:hypothetical protein PVAP13_6KG105500 [Panicum virgatum]|uniref:Uncharacterized protein n=1 Tax=Panicum virgatum TaxID=38727 RepID=A0A8T0RA61_PANVG|nr:hypothetical protein PVAP13_6KG105500 [Panicum virgatum]
MEYAAPSDLGEAVPLSADELKLFHNNIKGCQMSLTQLADQAAARSFELKGVEEELQLVVNKEKQLDAKMQEVAALQIELEKVKQHSAQENDLVKRN